MLGLGNEESDPSLESSFMVMGVKNSTKRVIVTGRLVLEVQILFPLLICLLEIGGLTYLGPDSGYIGK